MTDIANPQNDANTTFPIHAGIDTNYVNHIVERIGQSFEWVSKRRIYG